MTTTDDMRYGRWPGIDKPVSRIAQGCMMLDPAARDAGFALLDAALARGVTLFDNARCYGGGACDAVFGAWVRDRGVADEVVMLAKGCHPGEDGKRVTPEAVDADIAATREAAGLDRLDVWALHRDDPDVPVGELVDACTRAVRDGRIGAWGASNWRVDRLDAALAYAAAHDRVAPVVSSPNFSLAVQIDSPWGDDCVTISGDAHAADRAWYAQSGLAVATWSSLARGFLAGGLRRDNLDQVRDQYEEHTLRCYVCDANWDRQERAIAWGAARGLSLPQVALAYVLAQDFDAYALVGARDADELDANLAALRLPLDATQRAWLETGA